MRVSLFFSRCLDPVLDSGKRNEDTVVAPQMPGGTAVGKPILHDQAHGGEDDTMGVTSAGQCQIRHVGVEVFLAY